MADRVGQQLGNYRLLRLLGKGAFAVVYLGEHLYLERPAAIKVLHVQMEPKTHEQFRREARTIAHLQHPHIVQVLDFGLDDQIPYLVMEHAPGGTLRSHYPKGTRLPIEQVVTYVKQIALALDYAHQQRVTHRDVKPENLLLNAKQEIVLSDFGLAVVHHALESLSTQEPAGTPLYMAPEQIQRHPCAASDQYALGIIAYEWLAGEAPFRGTLFEVFSHHLYHPPPSLCERLPDLPAAVEEAVFKALAKDPAQRFACVEDFAAALKEAYDATQPLTLPGLPKPQTHEQTVSQDTRFVPASRARAQADESFSTQPQPTTMQPTAQGEEAVPVMAPGPSLHRPTGSKQVKPSVSQNNRHRFLRRVRTFWIDGVLQHSLHGAALIILGLQEQLDALVNPWQLVLQHPDTPPHALPAGTGITEVYDAANGELLILGAPGAGKTTLLLEVARDLLDRAEHDEHHPMPVVFPLSSWAAKQQPLSEWMIEELTSKYDVPRKLARTWVDTDQILPLLDGLDEVVTQRRTACIETINAYHQEHPFLPLVVASRSADYIQQTGRVRLSSAVTIQPLTQQQVDEYLVSGGKPLWALRVALQRDAALRELTETPVMLSILTLTYSNMPVEELLRGGITPTRQQVFAHYVERMLTRRGAAIRYTQEQPTHWLSWLAGQMKQHNQTVFYLEHLQPDWLSGKRMRQAYDRWAVRFPAILMGALVSLAIMWLLLPYTLSSVSNLVLVTVLGGFIGWLLSAGSTAQRPHESSGRVRRGTWSRVRERLIAGVVIGLSVGLFIGLNYGLNIGLSAGLGSGLGSILLHRVLEKCNSGVSSLQEPQVSRKPKRQYFLKSVDIKNGVLVGLVFGLVFGLVSGLFDGLVSGLFVGWSAGLGTGLSAWLLSVLLTGKSVGISLTDELIWSWRSLGRSLFAKKHMNRTLRVIALVGLFTWLLAGLGYGLSAGLVTGLSYGLCLGLCFWLLLGLFQGVSSETIGDQHRVVPNQGIRRSARNSLVFGLISIGIVGLLNGLNTGLRYGLNAGLNAGLSYGLNAGLRYGLSAGLIDALSFGLSVGLGTGLSAGLLALLLNGGLACLRHSVIRLLLWRSGAIPWNYPRFLDAAAERILLRKVGGGYIFAHRLLLEYFASVGSTPKLDAARVKKEQASPVS